MIKNFKEWNLNEGRIPLNRHKISIKDLTPEQHVKLFILNKCRSNMILSINLINPPEDALQLEKAGKLITGDRIIVKASMKLYKANETIDLYGYFSLTDNNISRFGYGKCTPKQKKDLEDKMFSIVKSANTVYSAFQKAPTTPNYPEKPTEAMFELIGMWHRLTIGTDTEKFTFKQFGVSEAYGKNMVIAVNDKFRDIGYNLTATGMYNLINSKKFPHSTESAITLVYSQENEKMFGKDVAWKLSHVFPYYTSNLLNPMKFDKLGNPDNLIKPEKDEEGVKNITNAAIKKLVKWSDIKSIITIFGNLDKYRGALYGDKFGLGK